jgi:3-dehydroquinate synthetase
VVDAAVKVQLGRRDAFLAFGGERTCQLTALTAASYRRFTRCVRIQRDLAAVLASVRDGARIGVEGDPVGAVQRSAHIVVDEDALLAYRPAGPAEGAALLALAALDRPLLDTLRDGGTREWPAAALDALLRLCRALGPGHRVWRLGESWRALAPGGLDRDRQRAWSVLFAARVARTLDLFPPDSLDDLAAVARWLDPALLESVAGTPDRAAVRRFVTAAGSAAAAALPGAELCTVDHRELELALAGPARLHPKAGRAGHPRPGRPAVATTSRVAVRAQVETRTPTSFPVRLVEGVFDPAGESLDELLPDGCQVLAVVDPYAPELPRRVHRFLTSRRERGQVARFAVMQVPVTEATKSLELVERVTAEASGLGLGPRDRIVVVGGGTVMDVVGYAAYLYQGDTPYIRIPTTLVGMIDAGVGLKVGVNVNGHKNLLGAYHPPLACVCDDAFLGTLAPAELRCGIAEAAKMGIVCDERLFALIETGHADVLNGRRTDAVREILHRSIASMLRELEANPYEQQLRRLPDFGHEFAHTLESLSRYRLRHGEAVAIGMGLSCCLAASAGYLARADLERILALLRAVGLALFDSVCEPDVLWRKLHEDSLPHKGGRLYLVVPRRIGEGDFIDSIDEISADMLREACDELRTWSSGGPR